MKLQVKNYTFDKVAKTVTFTDYTTIDLDSILLITNVTVNPHIIIYLFGPPASGGTNKGGSVATNVLTLQYDTTAMANTDKLLIYYDDKEVSFGAKTETAPATDTASSGLNGRLQRIAQRISALIQLIPTSLGRTTASASLPVVTASDEILLEVSGTGSALNATPIPSTDVSKYRSVSLHITGTFVAGVIFQASNNGTTFFTIYLRPTDVTLSPSGASINLDCAGWFGLIEYKYFRVSVVPYTSGTVTVTALFHKNPLDRYMDGDVGAISDSIVAAGATGSISAKLRRATQGLEDLKSLISLAAGANLIGKVSTDQTTHGTTDLVAADITKLAGTAVDVNSGNKSAGTQRVIVATDQPNLTTPLNVNIIQTSSIAQLNSLLSNSADRTDVMYNGTNPVNPKFAKIDRATNADGAAVVNIVSLKKIRVISYSLICSGTVSIKWQSTTNNSSGSGVDTDLTGLMAFVANTGISESYCPGGLLETATGEGLKLNLNAAVQVSGRLTYIEV